MLKFAFGIVKVPASLKPSHCKYWTVYPKKNEASYSVHNRVRKGSDVSKYTHLMSISQKMHVNFLTLDWH